MVIVVEEVLHLGCGKGTPAAVGTLATIGNLVVAPLRGTLQGTSSTVVKVISGFISPNGNAITLDTAGAVVITVSTPCEEVAVILVLNFALVAATEVELVVSELPILVGQGDIFEITF